MQELLTNLGPLIATYGYVALFLIAIIEGPIIGLIAGALAAADPIALVPIFFVLFVADLVGDILYYLLGRWGNIEVLKRVSSRLGLDTKKFEPIEAKFKEHDWKILLFGKTQAWGSVILYFSGTVGMPFGRFLFWNVVGTVPKALIFELAGYFLGEGVVRSQHYLDYAGIGAFILFLLLLGGYFLSKRYFGRMAEA